MCEVRCIKCPCGSLSACNELHFDCRNCEESRSWCCLSLPCMCGRVSS